MNAAAPLLMALSLALMGRRRRIRPTRRAGRVDGRRMTRPAAGALGVATALVVGGPLGLGIGAGAFVAADRVLRKLEPAKVRKDREDRQADLPLTLDLLSVCLQAGMPLVAALEAVAAALPGPFSEDLGVIAGLQRLGTAAPAAWAGVAADDDLAPVARAVGRSAESGSRLGVAFDRLAASRRSGLAAAGLARARSAGVLAMAPLGLCFLPAFVCLGIVPIVLSLAKEVLP
ncbi:MAG TPA: type II secretion system F family protein [Mycobacteriales bacterium]|jgi:pilus assembly protein TadC|nr:type II secretion system F family protein [Mycobacteriales bacterium]